MGQTHITSDIPQTLSDWRAQEQIDTYVAAKRLRISQSYYCRLENGTRHASGEMAKRIHQITQVPVDVLVGAA